MKHFKINENQLSQIWNVLSELPAKNVINILDLIRTLPVIEENKDN